MKPIGTTHLLIPGVAATARRLGIDFVKVVIGFKWGKGKALPKVSGVLVKNADVSVLSDACGEVQVIQLGKVCLRACVCLRVFIICTYA
eukprot:m.215463 g.215463  ORF g.215463 m.215463 type:complete len:89 (+) comp13800_c0_seq13:2010-2276(+)